MNEESEDIFECCIGCNGCGDECANCDFLYDHLFTQNKDWVE